MEFEKTSSFKARAKRGSAITEIRYTTTLWTSFEPPFHARESAKSIGSTSFIDGML